MPIKVFKDDESSSMYYKSAEQKFNQWEADFAIPNKVKIVSLQTSASTYEYIYKPELSRGPHDHEKRSQIITIITVLYE